MPSVTSILSMKHSSYLADLEEKIGKEELNIIGNRAAIRGSAMHKFLENYMICLQKKGNKNNCLLYTQRKTTSSLMDEMENEMISKGRNLFYNIYHSGTLDRIKKVLFTEQFLYSEEHCFAGTTDFGFLDINNKIILADFKSASFERPQDIVSKYKCQVAAYAMAFEELYNKKINKCEIWISHQETLQIEEVQGKELETYKEEFSDLCLTYLAMWDTQPFEDFVKTNLIF